MCSISCAGLMKLKPSNTAIKRTKASPVARKLVTERILKNNHISTILDYGCGFGCDVSYYKKRGFSVRGFDPYGPPEVSAKVTGQFDLVVCQFVLNVIEDSKERAQVCKRLFHHTKINGLIVVSTRSPKAIEEEAERKQWKQYKDGFISSAQRRTFQRGISESEIISHFGNSPIEKLVMPFTTRSAVCVTFLRKTGRQ